MTDHPSDAQRPRRPRGVCPECGKDVALLTTGLVGVHRGGVRRWCGYRGLPERQLTEPRNDLEDLRDQNILWGEWMAEVQAKLAASEADLGRAREEIERLRLALVRVHSEYRELEETARVAEGKAALADRARFTMQGVSKRANLLIREVTEAEAWFTDYDALTPAADAAEGGKDG